MSRIRSCLALSAFLSSIFSFGSEASPLKPDEEIVFFPTAAALSTDGTTWSVPVHGWVFEKEADSLLRGALISNLRKALGVASEGEAGVIFRERARMFVVDNKRGKEITVRLNDRLYSCVPSGANGHFLGEVEIPAATGASGSWIGFTAVLPEGDGRTFAGRAQLIAPGARMVISDVDDTVKETGSRDKDERMANTFTRPFRAVEGMAAVYRGWAKEGATFHYVSGSPWQLYPFFAEGFAQAGLPPGAFHLRLLRLTDGTGLAFFSSPEEYKVEAIESIIRRYPKGSFILVGDSGEKDPEVYGEIARRYPGRIENIFIRDVSLGESQAGRFEKIFGDLPASRWHIFKRGDELFIAPHPVYRGEKTD